MVAVGVASSYTKNPTHTNNNMPHATAEIVGYVGAVFLAVMVVPQVVHTYRTRHTADLSLAFILLQISTCVLFVVFGVLTPNSWPVVVGNGLSGLSGLLLLIAKFTFEKKAAEPDADDADGGGKPDYVALHEEP